MQLVFSRFLQVARIGEEVANGAVTDRDTRATEPRVASHHFGRCCLARSSVSVHRITERRTDSGDISGTQRSLLRTRLTDARSVGVHVAAGTLDVAITAPVFRAVAVRCIAIGSRSPVIRLRCESRADSDIVLAVVGSKSLAGTLSCRAGHASELARASAICPTSDLRIAIVAVHASAAAVRIAITIPVPGSLDAATGRSIALVRHAAVGICIELVTDIRGEVRRR